MRSFLVAPKFSLSSGKNPGKPKKRHLWLKALAYLFTFGVIIGITSAAGVFLYFSKDLPSPGKINKRFIAESTKIYDRTGEHLLYEVHGEEKRTLIPFKDMPAVVKYATISLEDQSFYSHRGIKLTSIIRSAIKDFLGRGAKQGGSTITQQLIKNTILTNEKTLTRKVKEVILSLEVEQKFSKDEILEMYLNEIPYGSNAYGIESAAQTFFGKPAIDLTLDEATMIAALPQATTFYSPFGSHLEALKIRQEIALQQMANLGYITQEEAELAKSVDVFNKLRPKIEAIAAPHFVMYIKEYLESKYGAGAVEEQGLNVYTTLDWDKQQVAEQVVREGVEKNVKWDAENASLVAMDPKTGQILAMVGSKDYFDTSIDGQVNVAIRDRQPGSSFKPFVYLTAFTKGYTPETILYDVETNFETDQDEDYSPQNYDGKFRGPLKMKEALGQSLNVPAVKTLYLSGINDATVLAKRLGITGLNDPKRYGLSLVLGGGEVKLLDHVSAYATIANGGVRQEKSAILKIIDAQGAILEEYIPSQGERVVEEKYVAMLDHIISTNKYRAPTFGENNPLKFDGRPVAAKTGTTNDWRDGWTMGFTPSLAVGVWAGNNDNSEMADGADGSYVAAPIWRAFLDKVLENYNIEEFPKYEEEETGIDVLDGKLNEKKNVKVCKIPGSDNYCLASSACPDSETKKRDFISAHTILYYINKNNPREDKPKNTDKDPQYSKWQKGIEKWYDKEKNSDYILDDPPKDECQADDFTKYLPKLSLSASQSNLSSISLSADVDAPHGVSSVDFLVNGESFHSVSKKPFEATYAIPDDRHGVELKFEVKLKDKGGNEITASTSLTTQL